MANASDIDRLDILLEPGFASEPKPVNYDREKGADTVGGMPTTSFVGIKKNPAHKRLISWYEGENNEPDYLIHLAKNNPLLLGILTTLTSIMHGRGIALYQDGEKLPPNQWPDQIAAFADKCDLDALLYDLLFAWNLTGNAFAELIFSRGSAAVNEPKRIVDVYYTRPEAVRAGLPTRSGQSVRHYYVSPKWADKQIDLAMLDKVRAFNRRDFYRGLEFTRDVGYSSVMWHFKQRIPGFPHYAPPSWYGGRRFIELHNHIPVWHIANITNMFGARVVVYVSRDYIREKVNKIKEGTNPPRNWTVNEVKGQITDLVKDHLTNPKNAGRVLTLEESYDNQGKPIPQIRIETIKLEVGDNMYSGMLERLNEVVTSGIGVDPSISGIIMNGKLSSGSEKRNAWNLERMKAWHRQRQVLRMMEFIHQFNQWPTEYRWDFEPHPEMATTDEAPSGIQTESNQESNQDTDDSQST